MADLFTFSTLNTFPISDRFHIHAALTHALATVSALPLIHLNSPEWKSGRTANKLLRADRKKRKNYDKQNRCLPKTAKAPVLSSQRAHLPPPVETDCQEPMSVHLPASPPDRYICKMTAVEIRSGKAKYSGNINHKQSKNSIFQPGKYPGYPVFPVFWHRDLVKQFLNQSKGTQKAANHSPQEQSGKNQKAENIKWETNWRTAQCILQRPKRTGGNGPRTGIAV